MQFKCPMVLRSQVKMPNCDSRSEYFRKPPRQDLSEWQLAGEECATLLRLTLQMKSSNFKDWKSWKLPRLCASITSFVGSQGGRRVAWLGNSMPIPTSCTLLTMQPFSASGKVVWKATRAVNLAFCACSLTA